MLSAVALLLAAGKSSRMGELKALLSWQDKPLIQHQIASLSEAGLSSIVVVLGHQAYNLEPFLGNNPKVHLVHNPHYEGGKTTSITTGLHTLGKQLHDFSKNSTRNKPLGDALLILNVDQPRSASTIRHLIKIHQTSKSLISIPTYKGKGGHPTIFSTALMPELLGISESNQGLKAVVRRHHAETQQIEMTTPEILLDLNTPEDYNQAQKSFFLN